MMFNLPKLLSVKVILTIALLPWTQKVLYIYGEPMATDNLVSVTTATECCLLVS